MYKHAYLIICHNKWNQLGFMLNSLDDPRNDFYILVDSKAKDFDRDKLKCNCSNEQLHFVEPIDICWGDFSLIHATFSLLNEAVNNYNYSYYHLISGADMPLKSQRYIHDFFNNNAGYEFVDFDSFDGSKIAVSRLKYYYFLQTIVGRRRISGLKLIRDIIVLFEKIIGVNRVRNIQNYISKGSNWFSITDDFARFIVSKEDFIRKTFTRCYCGDEEFVQTLLKMSPYKDKWYGFKNQNLRYCNHRYLDWGRGAPYTFNKDDYFELCSGEYLFARKFSEDIISEDVIDYLRNT